METAAPRTGQPRTARSRRTRVAVVAVTRADARATTDAGDLRRELAGAITFLPTPDLPRPKSTPEEPK